MSDISPAPPSSPARSGWLTALMLIAGIVLLLPGLCALFFGYVALTERSWPSSFTSFIGLGLLIGAGGVAVIVRAFRNGTQKT
jgi:uncharacterized membrane protein HdeD (DUF308 family)